MIKICLCYSNECSSLKDRLVQYMQTYPEIVFENWNESIFSEKKHAFKVKNQFAAKDTPFCGVFKGSKIVKGFYSEAQECEEQTIKDYITRHFARYKMPDSNLKVIDND